jgi:hypothetical protein
MDATYTTAQQSVATGIIITYLSIRPREKQLEAVAAVLDANGAVLSSQSAGVWSGDFDEVIANWQSRIVGGRAPTPAIIEALQTKGFFQGLAAQ